MASSNHQFLEYSGNVVARYYKTVPYIVTGLRLNPHNPSERIAFVLQTPEEQFDFDLKERKDISYNDEVLELYSDTEAKLFERLNASLFENGLLATYTGQTVQINKSNYLTDEEVELIAGTRTVSKLQERLSTITSRATVTRILEAAQEMNRPVRIVTAISDKLHELTRSD